MIFEALDGDTTNQDSYLDKLSYFGCANIFYKLVGIPHLRKDKTDAELLPFATKIIERMAAIKNEKPSSYSYLSASEWEREADRVVEDLIAEDYSEILKNNGNFEKALEYSRYGPEESPI